MLQKFVGLAKRQHLENVEIVRTNVCAVDDASFNGNSCPNRDNASCPDYVNIASFLNLEDSDTEMYDDLRSCVISPSHTSDFSSVDPSQTNQPHSLYRGNSTHTTTLQPRDHSRATISEGTPGTRKPLPVSKRTFPKRPYFDKSQAATLSPNESRISVPSRSRFRFSQDI